MPRKRCFVVVLATTDNPIDLYRLHRPHRSGVSVGARGLMLPTPGTPLETKRKEEEREERRKKKREEEEGAP